MKHWPWLRIVAVVAGPLAGLVAALFPPAAPIAIPLGTFLTGVAVRTPGHVPATPGSVPVVEMD